MKICNCNDCEIFETRAYVNNWQQFTGHFRVRVPCSNDVIAFDLPGHGGRVTQKAAGEIHTLWHAGKTAGEISSLTGCRIAS
jgi:pimeloyl-ACP methyl ester carboxylesterase